MTPQRAPLYSLRRQKTGLARTNVGKRKLTRWEVAEIRRWARTAGFGIPLMTQVEQLRAEGYQHLGVRTVQDVLTNQSWYDPTYTPGEPLLVPESQTGTAGASWLLVMLIVLQSLMGSRRR
jgi:hypothetical protein